MLGMFAYNERSIVPEYRQIEDAVRLRYCIRVTEYGWPLRIPHNGVPAAS